MSFSCVHGGHECNGCMCCQPEPEPIGKCWCGEPIHADETRYEIGGEIIHEDCLKDWAEQYKID